LPQSQPDQTPGILANAQLEALARLFPDWRIWSDHHGWYARRRSDGFLQVHEPGTPVFCLRAVAATDLAAQLCWQQAADERCQVSVAAPA
jgi:hypothetical protein